MKEKRYIVDTTLRDGEQRPGIALRPQDKVKLALLLDELGVYEIEVGTPTIGVEGTKYIEEIKERRKQAKLSVWSRVNVEDVIYSVSCAPDLIHIGVPVSYVQIYNKLKKNKTWVHNSIRTCVKAAQNKGVEVTVGFEDASRADVGFMIHTAKLLKSLGVPTIRIADTVGVLSPARTNRIITEILQQVDICIEIHAHNDLGMAVANSIEAAKAGAKYVDCTLLGIGERTGNCNLYDFVNVGERIFDLGIPLSKISKAEKVLQQYKQNGGIVCSSKNV